MAASPTNSPLRGQQSHTAPVLGPPQEGLGYSRLESTWEPSAPRIGPLSAVAPQGPLPQPFAIFSDAASGGLPVPMSACVGGAGACAATQLDAATASANPASLDMWPAALEWALVGEDAGPRSPCPLNLCPKAQQQVGPGEVTYQCSTRSSCADAKAVGCGCCCTAWRRVPDPRRR
jgi:hypothetical protein